MAAACGGTTAERAIVPAPTQMPATTSTTIALTTTTATPTTPAAPTTSATAPATSVASTVALPTSSPAGPQAILRPDGLGDLPFGTESEAALAQLTTMLGAPTTDSGWVSAFDSKFGVCPGELVRGVTWGSLLVLFADETLAAVGKRHLYFYAYGPDPLPAGLTTPEGVGVGSTVAALRIAYPSVQVYPDDVLGPSFAVSPAGLAGSLSDITDAGVVRTITGGEGCGE